MVAVSENIYVKISSIEGYIVSSFSLRSKSQNKKCFVRFDEIEDTLEFGMDDLSSYIIINDAYVTLKSRTNKYETYYFEYAGGNLCGEFRVAI